MITVRRRAHQIGSALLVAALCLTTAALADNTMETIVVQAAVMTKTVVGHTTIGAPEELVTLTHRVSYADLDLSTYSGATELKRRVQETARIVCEQLDKLYPLEEKEAPDCTRRAVAKAESQVDAAIANAGHEDKDE